MNKAAYALVALCLMAGSAQAQSRIIVAAGDMTSPAAQMEFDRNLRIASERLCRHVIADKQSDCRNAVQTSAVNQLPEDDRAAFTRWKQSRQAR